MSANTIWNMEAAKAETGRGNNQTVVAVQAAFDFASAYFGWYSNLSASVLLPSDNFTSKDFAPHESA